MTQYLTSKSIAQCNDGYTSIEGDVIYT